MYKTNFKSVVESIPETETLFYLLYTLNNVCLTYLLVSYIWIITIENVNMWSLYVCVCVLCMQKRKELLLTIIIKLHNNNKIPDADLYMMVNCNKFLMRLSFSV